MTLKTLGAESNGGGWTQTAVARKLLFSSLYLSEGAPIGFIWLALPTRLRVRDVPIEQITWLTAILVLPWTFKFVWAPLIDVLRGKNWTLRHWIVSAQVMMGLTLTPLLWLDPLVSFNGVAFFLFLHALSAATQDVAIDAYCISTTSPGERGAYNGWMQTGMLLGRALMGGGALVMSAYLGDFFVVVLLILLTTYSMALVIAMPQRPLHVEPSDTTSRLSGIYKSIRMALVHRNTWSGLAFGCFGGAAFKSLEVFYGPYLVDRGVSQDAIGWFSLGPMIAMMVVGSIAGGRMADRLGARTCVACGLTVLVFCIVSLATLDLAGIAPAAWFAFPLLAAAAFGIGVFTASLYTLFMDLSHPSIAATQFSAFMGSTNGCEAWSGFVSGLIIAQLGYPAAMFTMSFISMLTLPVLVLMKVSWTAPGRVQR